MNPDTQIPTPEIAVSSPEPGDSSPEPATPFNYRGNGKVARFPKPIRDQINHWMLAGISYPDIIQRLGEQGKDLKPDNLSQWKKRGHQDWLLEQTWLAHTRARQDPASDLATDFDATQVNHAALQLGALHIFEALRDLHPHADGGASCPVSNLKSQISNPVAIPSPRGEGQGEGEQNAPQHPVSELKTQNSKLKTFHPLSQLDLKLGGDSSAFVRLINALARASRETMLVQKYRDACARARATLHELKDPKRKLNESETRAIVLKVDHILGLRSDNDEPAAVSSSSSFSSSSSLSRSSSPNPEPSVV